MFSSEEDLIDLERFEVQDKICLKISKLWKYYKIMNLDNGAIYTAKISNEIISNIGKEILLNLSREIYVVSKLNYPSILKFYGYSLTNFKNKPKPTIIFEYVSKITLYMALTPKFTKDSEFSHKIFDDTKKLIIIYGIASAMLYLHSHNIIHRGLNVKQIFLDENFYPKLSGFDFSIELKQSEDYQNQTIESKTVNDLKYLPFEVKSRLKYSKSSDVYAFAIIMLEILSNQVFDEDNFKQAIDSLNEDCYLNLIKKCISENPEKRPTFEYIVNELKNNSEFIKNSVNSEEFHNYIKFINESKINFSENKQHQKINELLKFDRIKINTKLKGPPYTGTYLDLTKYTLKYPQDENNEYRIYFILYNDKKDITFEEKISLLDSESNEEQEQIEDNILETYSFAEIYNREINNFYQHEIINLSRRLSIISQINHPCILNFIGYSPVDFSNKRKPLILNEYCFTTIDCIDDDCDYTTRLMYIYGITYAMAFLHSHGIIHRNLKPSVIRIDKYEIPKITGFDIAKEIGNESSIKSKKIKGAPAYLAPEIYLYHEYSKSSDVYSFGLLMYKIMTNKDPFNDLTNPNEIKKKICDENERPKFETPIFQAYRNLIERCWSQNPKERPTFEEILNELKTNSEFITADVNDNLYFGFIDFLEKYPKSFDPSKRIDDFDDIISSRLHTFEVAEPYPNLQDMYDTETNDLSFDYSFFNFTGFKSTNITSGSFYKVDELINLQTKEKYAKKDTIYNLYDYSQSEIKNFKREIKIISQLNHPSILKYIGYNIEEKYSAMPSIIVEYSPYGSLYNYKSSYFDDEEVNHNEKIIFNETKKLIYFYGVASGIAYLHSHNIIHRDLKIQNIFLDSSLYPKISGFNISKEIGDETFIKSQKIKGTPAYIAPEVYLHHEYSKMSDVYSFGLIMYEIMLDEKPFNDNSSPKEVKEAICDKKERPMFLKPIYEPYRNLIERCWSQNPEERPTFESIVIELKTNPEFITDKIDKEEFFNYIKQIDESHVSFDSTKKNLYFENIINNKDIEYADKNFKINILGIYETQLDSISIDYNFINIQNYEKQKKIRDEDDFKIYKVIDKKTGQIYRAKKMKKYPKGNSSTYIQMINNEVNFLLKINHRSFLKFIGYSLYDFKNRNLPIIITEYGVNGNLENILDIDMSKQNEMILNDTKRLIIMYGIASAMAYLHSHDIIHCDLRPSNIYLDEFLFPKISEFCNAEVLSKNQLPNVTELDFDSVSFRNIYHSPEYCVFEIQCSASDVYSFAIIAYQLITNEKPFEEEDFDLIEKICTKNFRPSFKNSVPECYRKLIEKCWATNPKDRPTFDEIAYHLKTNPEFITENINKKEFESYISFINDSKLNNFNQLDDFFQSKNPTFRKVEIDFKKIKNPTKLNFSVNMGSVNLNKYAKLDKVGSGSFGIVYKILEKETDIIYAAKISIYELDQCSNDSIVNLSREINIISKLKHPSILQFIGFSPNNFKNKQKPTIITEYASNCSLDKIIEETRLGYGNYDWNDTKKLINIYGIASGMAYLHHMNILHRDLKPGNILLDDFLYPKIADFGLSKTFFEEDILEIKKKKPITSGFKGTLAYCAPEIIGQQIYSKAGGVYAYAMIVYEIITNEILFKGFNQYQLILNVTKGYRPKFNFPIPYCYRKLIEKCWSNDYGKRPEFSEIVKLLETDSNFITANVDKDEYFDYISSVKESQQSFLLPNQPRVKFSNDNNEKKSKSIKKAASRMKIIENEPFESISCYLNLDKYERKEIISKSYSSKLYKIIEIDTGKFYVGQMSMFTIDEISKHDIDKLTDTLDKISRLNHPCLLKFIGYSLFDFKKQRKPIILTEYFSNGTLSDILEIERINKPIQGWNDTKKLITIYGIASAMSYLHSQGIIFKSLRPCNIFLNEILSPKLGDFGLSTRFDSLEKITHQSISGVKATPIYSSPEVLQNNEFSKSSDVYAFAFVVYEIICKEVPFSEMQNHNQIIKEVVINQKRPKIKEFVPKSYQNLIEICWSQKSSERPTFEEIVFKLKMDSGFITNMIDKDDFQKYIKFIDDQLQPELLQKIDENVNKNATEQNKINESIENSINESILIKKNYLTSNFENESHIETLENLALKYIQDNDTENIYRIFCSLIKTGNFKVPLNYAVSLYTKKCYKQSFNYFSLLWNSNHPIAKYFIGIMKFKGQGCEKNREESYYILKYLSDNGIDKATSFLEKNYKNE